jgi:hypothetical protein
MVGNIVFGKSSVIEEMLLEELCNCSCSRCGVPAALFKALSKLAACEVAPREKRNRCGPDRL